jgi:hypothetical protein
LNTFRQASVASTSTGPGYVDPTDVLIDQARSE